MPKAVWQRSGLRPLHWKCRRSDKPGPVGATLTQPSAEHLLRSKQVCLPSKKFLTWKWNQPHRNQQTPLSFGWFGHLTSHPSSQRHAKSLASWASFLKIPDAAVSNWSISFTTKGCRFTAFDLMNVSGMQPTHGNCMPSVPQNHWTSSNHYPSSRVPSLTILCSWSKFSSKTFLASCNSEKFRTRSLASLWLRWGGIQNLAKSAKTATVEQCRSWSQRWKMESGEQGQCLRHTHEKNYSIYWLGTSRIAGLTVWKTANSKGSILHRGRVECVATFKVRNM